MSLGKRLIEVRKDLGLEIKDFCSILESKPQSYNNWISEKNSPGAQVLIKLLESFPQYNPTWLLLGEGEKFRISHLVEEPDSDYNLQRIRRLEYKVEELITINKLMSQQSLGISSPKSLVSPQKRYKKDE